MPFHIASHISVASRVEAWIETLLGERGGETRPVASRVEAWIETVAGLFSFAAL